MRKTTALRRLLTRPEIAFLLEAHNGVSARIVEEAGFEGIWASGLTTSAAFGVRDNNELSWSQVTDHVAFMAEATAIPVLLDCHLVAGDFDYMLKIRVSDMADFNRLHSATLIGLPGVRQTRTFFVMKEVIDNAPLDL